MEMRAIPPAVTPVKITDLLSAVGAYTGEYSLETPNFADFIGLKEVYTYSSWGGGLREAIINLKRIAKTTKNEVIIPRFCCPTFLKAVRDADQTFIKLGIRRINISKDINSVKQSLSDKTLALVAINHFGLANDMQKLKEFCSQHSIFLIEDATYSMGTELRSGPVGSFGDISVFNFREGKAIPVGGGAIGVNSERIKNNYRRLHQEPTTSPVGKILAYSILQHPTLFYLYKGLTNPQLLECNVLQN